MNPCAKRRIENKCMYEPISEKCFACKYFINKSQTVIVAHFLLAVEKFSSNFIVNTLLYIGNLIDLYLHYSSRVL